MTATGEVVGDIEQGPGVSMSHSSSADDDISVEVWGELHTSNISSEEYLVSAHLVVPSEEVVAH